MFDMDGTLTRARHDFPAMKRELGLPPDRPILEALDELPGEEARWRRELLDEIEREVASGAEMAEGADMLLGSLAGAGRALGVITRNTRHAALLTLEQAGLGRYFDEGDVVGREEAAPKPAPDGIDLLLRRKHVAPDNAILVGDFAFDVLAARAAGVTSVLVGGGEWLGDFRGVHADLHVDSLLALVPAIVVWPKGKRKPG